MPRPSRRGTARVRRAEAYGTSPARKTVFERSTNHRIDAVTDPYGRRTELHYDSAGHVTSSTELAGTDQARPSNFPGLLDTHGVSPDSAAALLISAGDNPDRLSSEASLAALCGTSPVEASSGKTRRRRLNRGGDRQANAALYRIVLSRLRWDDRAQDYLRRRIAEGETRREIIRCLKRYVAREIYRLIAPIRTAACPAEPNRTAS